MSTAEIDLQEEQRLSELSSKLLEARQAADRASAPVVVNLLNMAIAEVVERLYGNVLEGQNEPD